ncbi:DUF4956 domain-containing protein [Tissierella sp.]|uniref:DUF4956 domain-containing protein n=1 Tax=Tissierella sp. TaxID=41274 RepID=UPI002864FB1E|nr:DUF4956 domain-containing protein [Tissierella sp.]MDR7855964.1 DUF4956 domain-containing protein [Tissierella sp.]
MSQEILFNIIGGMDTFSIERIVFNIIMATLLGLFIYFVYKKTFSGVIYSQSFNITIVMVCVIIAIIMMLIGKNIALSLGLVGSLSIIRFRTVIKDPRDMGFLFWGIAVGLAAGTGEFLIAIIGSIVIALVLFIFSKLIYIDYCYLLVLRGVEIESKIISDVLREYKIPYKMRMKTTNRDFTEVTYEITLKSVKEDFLVKTFRSIDGIEEVHIVSYDGEVTG